jgi:hypothetical protein
MGNKGFKNRRRSKSLVYVKINISRRRGDLGTFDSLRQRFAVKLAARVRGNSNSYDLPIGMMCSSVIGTGFLCFIGTFLSL